MSEGMHGKFSKIPNVYKRDPETNLLTFEYSSPELEALTGSPGWDLTEKVDGTNIRVGWDGDRVRVAGKSDNAQIPPHLYERLEELFLGPENEELFEQSFQDATPDSPVTLYGEGYGAKIQKGGGNYIPDGADFVLFDVRIGHTWLRREDVEGVAASLGGIDVVPEVHVRNWDRPYTLENAINVVDCGGQVSRWDGVDVPEGIVARAPHGMLDRRGNRIICKIKRVDFIAIEEASG